MTACLLPGVAAAGRRSSTGTGSPSRRWRSGPARSRSPPSPPTWACTTRRSTGTSATGTTWELAGRRPGAAGLIRSLPAPPAAGVAEGGRVRAGLEGHGFAPADARVARDLVADLALDTAAALEGLDRAAQDRAWRDDPGMRGLIAAPRGAYPVKLAIVLDGLAARLPR